MQCPCKLLQNLRWQQRPQHVNYFFHISVQRHSKYTKERPQIFNHRDRFCLQNPLFMGKGSWKKKVYKILSKLPLTGAGWELCASTLGSKPFSEGFWASSPRACNILWTLFLSFSASVLFPSSPIDSINRVKAFLTSVKLCPYTWKF